MQVFRCIHGKKARVAIRITKQFFPRLDEVLGGRSQKQKYSV